MAAQGLEGHRFLEHVTDAFIEAWGPTLERAFVQAGIGFFETMLDTKRVQPKTTDEIKTTGHDEMELLYNWLEELLLRFEVDGLALSKFNVESIQRAEGSLQLSANVGGEHYDPKKHGHKVGVKGVTYHQMAIEKRPRTVLVRFLLDL